MNTNCVILDCDGGSDDAWALLLLLKAEEAKRLEVLGITICGCGNTSLENAASNMLRILRASGRDEIPIFLGSANALIETPERDKRKLFHGADGFGDILPPEHIEDIDEMVEGEHAVAAIHQFCIENPKKVTIIAVGPLTNIALCYSMYDKDFADNVKDIYIMGGNHQGVGNSSRSAEFNFHSDPEAAHIVLARSKCPITILPWEPCMLDRFFICIKWRLEQLPAEATMKCPAFDILTKVEHKQYLSYASPGWNPCDAMIVVAFLFGKHFIRKESMWHATVDLKGCHTRGQMVLDHLHEIDKYPKNIRLIEEMDVEFFQIAIRWAIGLNDARFMHLSNFIFNVNQNGN